MYQIIMLYTLSLYNVLCQLFLNKAEGEKKESKTCYIFPLLGKQMFFHEHFMPNPIDDSEKYLAPRPSVADLVHLISPNTHAPCQHPSSNTGCYPWLCCQKIIFRGSLICDPENLNVGVILPKGTFDQQVKGVGRSRSQHSCSRGVQCRGAFKISPWV